MYFFLGKKTVNLQELMMKISVNRDPEKTIIDEANKILAESTEKEQKTLSRFGLDYSLKKKEAVNQRARLYDLYPKGRLFSINQIKSIAIKYGLRFLNMSIYKGTVDPQLSRVILEFENKYGFKHNDNYKILAPAESFKLEKRPKDPLAFVKVAEIDGEEFYYLLHKWGNDLNRWRRLVNLAMIEHGNFVFFLTIVCLMICGILAIIMKNFVLAEDRVSFQGIFAGMFVLWLVVFFFSSFGRYNTDNWNSKLE